MGSDRGLAVLLALSTWLAPALAWADVPPPGATPAPDGEIGSKRAGHHKQIGLSAQFVTGSRFIKTWDNTDYCGDRGEGATGNAVYCFSRVPVSLDLTATYGIRPHIELMFEMRFGLERDFGSTSSSGAGPRLRHYSPGVRFFFNDKGLLKFFATAQIALDS